MQSILLPLVPKLCLGTRDERKALEKQAEKRGGAGAGPPRATAPLRHAPGAGGDSPKFFSWLGLSLRPPPPAPRRCAGGGPASPQGNTRPPPFSPPAPKAALR